jgi:hypothetical protein
MRLGESDVTVTVTVACDRHWQAAEAQPASAWPGIIMIMMASRSRLSKASASRPGIDDSARPEQLGVTVTSKIQASLSVTGKPAAAARRRAARRRAAV